jgi:hypothetical protein
MFRKIWDTVCKFIGFILTLIIGGITTLLFSAVSLLVVGLCLGIVGIILGTIFGVIGICGIVFMCAIPVLVFIAIIGAAMGD